MTPTEAQRGSTSHRARALVLGVGLLITACSGSDATISGSVPNTAIESDGEVFSEGETATDETAASDAPDGSDVDAAGSADDVDSEDATAADSDEGSAEAGDPTLSDPVATGGAPSTDQNDSADSSSDEVDEIQPQPDEFDEIGDLITIDDVDDVPFCKSYARVFESFLGITFAGVFGGLSSDDPDAQVALAETYEVILYPGLAGDIETIRGEGIDELEQIFGPLFERIDAAPGLLRDAGLSDAEIDELTTGVRAADLESVDLDGLDPRVTDAAVALRSEFGSFLDASDALATPPEDEAALEDRLDALCPLLAESFGEV